jgi:16S rRNA (guanine527-N7)-methyltransferase
MSGSAAPALIEVLERARSVGFLGPGPVGDHIEHAARFGEALRSVGSPVGRVADIGSGGGVPGLALLMADPDLEGVLIDAAQKRCSFLVWAVATLGLVDRVEVWCGRAETIAHEARARERFDAVVARGFGPPATTLECATGLVRPGGLVVISEPPRRRRWPAGPLAELALAEATVAGPGPSPTPGVAVFVRGAGLDERFPRSAKELQRHPLFSIE